MVLTLLVASKKEFKDRQALRIVLLQKLAVTVPTCRESQGVVLLRQRSHTP